ncbi:MULTISPECIES: hypothetical protein [Hydrogenophaga]|uniref:Type II secretion system protein GspC N-terminal domain-containing protein n=2 Tax=Hydrogenophaga TaxID=47420 RepID=A0ABW2QEH3_9BURK
MRGTASIRPHHLLLLALLAAGSFGLYYAWTIGLQRLQAIPTFWVPLAPALPDVPAAQTPPPVPAALAVTRNRPLFWDKRQPPPPPAAKGPPVEPPRLLGVISPSGAPALVMLAQGNPPQQRVFRVRAGQTVGAFTVKSITPQGVELTGPNGPLSLSMPRRVRN